MNSIMNYFWDIIIAVMIISSVISCYRKGFLYSCVKTVGSLAAIIASYVVSLPLAKSVYDALFKNHITNGFETAFSSVGEVGMEQFKLLVENALARMPANLSSQMSPAFTEYMDNWYEAFIRSDFASFAENFAHTVAEPVITGLLRGICFLVIFFILSFLVKLVASLFKGVKYIPLLGSLNAILGALLGVITGVIHAVILCGFIWVILNFTGGIENIITPQMVENSIIMKKIFETMPLLGGILTEF